MSAKQIEVLSSMGYSPERISAKIGVPLPEVAEILGVTDDSRSYSTSYRQALPPSRWEAARTFCLIVAKMKAAKKSTEPSNIDLDYIREIWQDSVGEMN